MTILVGVDQASLLVAQDCFRKIHGYETHGDRRLSFVSPPQFLAIISSPFLKRTDPKQFDKSQGQNRLVSCFGHICTVIFEM
uniref:Uncharacterized protein n=1 Tax=Trichuris muris TaxID=70415 RepID=A0A5S6QDE6_TRIMR